MINSWALLISDLVSIISSFLLTFILSILPLAPWILFVQPQWLELVTIYWIIVMLQRISLGTAWLLGLLLDALYGALLGKHALAMVPHGFRDAVLVSTVARVSAAATSARYFYTNFNLSSVTHVGARSCRAVKAFAAVVLALSRVQHASMALARG